MPRFSESSPTNSAALVCIKPRVCGSIVLCILKAALTRFSAVFSEAHELTHLPFSWPPNFRFYNIFLMNNEWEMNLDHEYLKELRDVV